jgi:hypothetical protein
VIVERWDTSIVDLHRADEDRLVVTSVEGEAWRVADQKLPAVRLETGVQLTFEDTVALGAGAQAIVGGLVLRGGRRGRAHAFVRDSAFRPSPSRDDVPTLLGQLEQIEEQMRPLGEDPLAAQTGPMSLYERAHSAEFARLNLVLATARSFDESLARMVRSVLLFVSEDTAFVAFARLSVPKLRTVMAELGRPIHPHLVEETVIDELLKRVYGR